MLAMKLPLLCFPRIPLLKNHPLFVRKELKTVQDQKTFSGWIFFSAPPVSLFTKTVENFGGTSTHNYFFKGQQSK